MIHENFQSAISAAGGRLTRVAVAGGLLLLMALSTSSRAAEPRTIDDERELTAIEKQWWESMKNHERAKLEAVLADDFMGVDNGAQPATTKRQWVDWAMKFPLKSYDIEKMEFRIDGDTAIVSLRYSTRVIRKDGEKTDHGVDMDIFVRRNGRWQALGTGEIHVVPSQ